MKNGQTILLLHGWGQGSSPYRQLSFELEKLGYRVYAPDMPGFGKTSIPEKPLHLFDYATFLYEYVEKNSIEQPVFLGHSFGGRVAIKYASLHRKECKAIILCGTPGYSPVKRWKFILALIIAKIGSIFFSLPLLSRFEQKIRSWFYYIVGARDYYRAQGSMRQTFKNIVGEKLEDDMKKIHIPTLLVWGEEDSIVPVRIAERMKKAISNSKLIVLPRGKHSVIVDDPNAFVNEVHSFLKSL